MHFLNENIKCVDKTTIEKRARLTPATFYTSQTKNYVIKLNVGDNSCSRDREILKRGPWASAII